MEKPLIIVVVAIVEMNAVAHARINVVATNNNFSIEYVPYI
jgi:hypothetical protein